MLLLTYKQQLSPQIFSEHIFIYSLSKIPQFIKFELSPDQEAIPDKEWKPVASKQMIFSEVTIHA